jgi:hypothetical protein
MAAALSWKEHWEKFMNVNFGSVKSEKRRIVNALFMKGIHTFEELAKTPVNELLCCHGIGRKSIEYMRIVLENQGFTLGEDWNLESVETTPPLPTEKIRHKENKKYRPPLNKALRGELLTAVQVGERLKLNEKTIYNWKRTGELPIDYFYINGNLRFDSADVEDYVNLSKHESPRAQLAQAILKDNDPERTLEEWLEPIMRKILRKHTRAGKLAEA